MKICVVTGSCDLSEMAQYRELADRGHRVKVFHDPEWQPGSALDGSDISTVPLSVGHRLDLHAIRSLRSELERDLPDLIYATYSRTLSVSLLATRGMPIKVTVYRGTVGHLSHFDPASLMTYFHPRLAGIICVSRAVEEYLRKMRVRAPLTTTYKGHDVEWYASAPKAALDEFGFPEDSFVAGFAGNVRPVKGIDILLRALSLLPETSRIRLLLVGEIRDRRVKRMLENPLLSARVCQAGFRPEAWRFTGACDAFVLASIRREGFCRAVIEAMAQQVPPVVTHVGGMPELVEHEVSGLVVPPSDPEALAAALLQMESDESARKRMGQAAQERIRRDFGVRQVTDRMERFFNSILAG